MNTTTCPRIFSRLATLATRACYVTGCFFLSGTFWFAVPAYGDQIAFDDFENVPLQPFTAAALPEQLGSDDTDWTNNIPGWTITNNFLNGFTCLEGAYDGWTAMDVDSWMSEQNWQGRGYSGTLGLHTRNTVLVADPDAAEDFNGGSSANPTNYNSWIHHDYDISTADLNTLSLTFDWEFRPEDSQRGLCQVSFDGGTNYQTLLDIDSDTETSPFLFGPSTFVSGTDFNPPGGATTMRVRFCCLDSGDDWWFAVDNVSLDDAGGNIEFEDFEGLTLVPFDLAGPVPPKPGVGLGPTWGDQIPNWTIDNSGMLAGCREEGYNGWRALNADEWVAEQGGQGRSKFALFVPDNTCLVADPDAYYDFAPPGGQPDFAFNSFMSRTYDLTGFDPRTLVVDLEWEFRVEDTQRGLIQVSFDGGATWQTLLDIDSDDGTHADGAQYDDETFGFTGTWRAADGDFTGCGTRMVLRFGCLDGDNDWWFAIDNVLIEGDPLGFVLGDANDDGVLNNGDIGAFVLALTDPAMYNMLYPNVDVDKRLDMNCDDVFNNGDIGGFVQALLGP